MPSPRLRGRVAVPAAAVALASLLLTGCSGGPVRDLMDHTVEETVESATGGDVELGGELPADFPDTVPVIDGRIEVVIRGYNEYSLAGELAGLVEWLEVTGPPGVRDHLTLIGKALIDRYG